MPRQKSLPAWGDSVHHQGHVSRLESTKRKAMIRKGEIEPVKYTMTVDEAAKVLVI
jgi:hypothetical protein